MSHFYLTLKKLTLKGRPLFDILQRGGLYKRKQFSRKKGRNLIFVNREKRFHVKFNRQETDLVHAIESTLTGAQYNPVV